MPVIQHGAAEAADMVAAASTAAAQRQAAGLRALVSLASRADLAGPGAAVITGPQPPRRFRTATPRPRRRLAISWPLLLTLIVQAALSLRLTWANSAFPDEALYLGAGHAELAHWLHGAASATAYPYYFSGAPVIYPPIGAVADSLGGLAGARILSLCFMLGATVLLESVTRTLFSRVAALLAAAVFAGTASAQFLGAFATYDAMALFLLALATWLGLRAAASDSVNGRVSWLAAAGLALAVADATKYAATLFDPVVITVVALALWRAKGRPAGVAGALLISWALGLLSAGGLLAGGSPYWQGISFTTLSRASGGYPPAGVLAVGIGCIAVPAVLSLIGAAVAACQTPDRITRALASVLALAVYLAPAEQARIHVFTSLFKHVGYGAWFGSVMAGYALAALSHVVPAAKHQKALAVSIVTAAVAVVPGMALARTHFHQWPNSSAFIAHLRPILQHRHGQILASDNGHVIQYYLPGEVARVQFSGTWYFRYAEPATGDLIEGPAAYRSAIRDRYFTVIALSHSPDDDNLANDKYIAQDIRRYGGYRLAARIPFSAAGVRSSFVIWLRT